MLAKTVCKIDVTKLARSYRAYCKKLQKHHGREFMIRRMSKIRSMSERYAIHQPIEPLEFVKSDKDGYPTVFSDFRPYLRSDDLNQRIMVLSIFRSVEIFRLAPSHDISTVVTPPVRNNQVLNDILNFIPGWVASLNKKLNIKSMKYHFTVKKGPNGPALMSSDSDLTAIFNDDKLLESLRVVSRELDDEFPFDESFHRSTNDESIHSKLTQFPEKAGKTRTIAVVDYYSQRALKPLHRALMDLLSSLETDGTMSHMNVGNYVQECTKQKSFVQTFDLSAFTDRFPREIQEKLLFELCENKELAAAWWSILADRTFTVAWSGEKVKYAAGQPMGAYASWPLCSLAHHAVVEYCRAKRKYRLIGDDVCITDKHSANLYEKIIQHLGVEVNPYKGTYSEQGSLFSSAEIAKRIYLNGIDLTPLTPGKILSLRNRYLCLEGIRELKQRFDNPALPRQCIEFHLPKGEARDYVWCLACNPLTGVVKPSDEGYENFAGWDAFEIEELKFTFRLIRIHQLTSQAMEYYKRTMPIGTYLASWASLNAGYLDVQYFTGGNWQIPTIQPEATILARRELLVQLFRGLETLANEPYTDKESMVLEAVEYLPDPDNPFLDQKDLRKIRMSSLLHKLYLHMSDCESSAATLQDDIEIPPYLSV
jgi:hypothetical protein